MATALGCPLPPCPLRSTRNLCMFNGNGDAFLSCGGQSIRSPAVLCNPSCGGFQFTVSGERFTGSRQRSGLLPEVEIFDGDASRLMHVQTLRNFPKEKLKGEVVAVRVDSTLVLDASCTEDGFVNKALYTIKYLHDAGAKVILLSNWDHSSDPILTSTGSFAERLSSILKLSVLPVNGWQLNVEELRRADIFLFENLTRFKGEVANSLDFSKKLSVGVGIFVNDSFSLAHKILASTVGIARFCYSSLAGFHFEEELHWLTSIAEATKRPFIAIIGGGIFLEKATALHLLASKCDGLMFVGKMAFQVMHALGMTVPMNLVEYDAVGQVLELIQLVKNRNVKIFFPDDFWCMENKHPGMMDIFPNDGILPGWMPIDVGPVSWENISSRLSKCKAYPSQLDWNSIFSDPTQHLIVDVGSGNGLFLFGMAKRWQSSNFLGLEINAKLVAHCLDNILQYGVKNVNFLSTNATSTFRSIISSYPGKLVLVSIQCPNPDFNKTDYRWKMVQRSLVEAITELLAVNGKVFLQSDIEEVARRMKEEFMVHGKGKFASDGDDSEGWIKENPFGVRSDWERHVMDRGAPMYRVLLRKVETGS